MYQLLQTPVDDFVPSATWGSSDERKLQGFSKFFRIAPFLWEFIMADDEKSFETTAYAFRFVPEKVFRRCIEFGIRYYIIEPDRPPAVFDKISKDRLGHPGSFIPSLKACCLNERSLKNPTFQRIALTVLANAFDYCLGRDDFASSRSLVYKLYLECKHGKENRQFINAYAQAGPIQYFAANMASYFSMDDPIYGRDMLEMMDNPMFKYLQALFRYYIKCL